MRLALLVALAGTALLATNPGFAHPGDLDSQGCHYEGAKRKYHCHRPGTINPNIYAPVKKSRENICHDERSSNYHQLKYFVAYESLEACLRSGGRRAAF
ncbi:MAG TPA: hypothetical protein VMF52_02745 [Steroidobacteraceae bacterium]|nr:hypothetical protein [Steroidobacteraceae bacterium]